MQPLRRMQQLCGGPLRPCCLALASHRQLWPHALYLTLPRWTGLSGPAKLHASSCVLQKGTAH